MLAFQLRILIVVGDVTMGASFASALDCLLGLRGPFGFAVGLPMGSPKMLNLTAEGVFLGLDGLLP